jgi:hypothetical protein
MPIWSMLKDIRRAGHNPVDALRPQKVYPDYILNDGFDFLRSILKANMFGPFRASAPLSGGLLWYALLYNHLQLSEN